MKKRILALLLAMMVLLSACGTAGQSSQTDPIESQNSELVQSQPGQDSGTDATEESQTPPSTDASEQADDPSQPAQENEPDRPESQPSTEPTVPSEAPTTPTVEETDPPTQPPSGDGAILDAAYALAPGQSLEGTYTLSGTVAYIIDPYSSHYRNITLMMTVPGSEKQPVQCFRLEGEGVEHLEKGDVITVSGRLMNYKGTIEFDAGCELVSYTLNHPVEEPEQPPQTGGNNDDSRDAVALYIYQNGCLPDFYLTKSQARSLYGWTGGPLDKLAPGLCIGGDTFTNYQKVLPDAPGRRWTECDIDTIGAGARGAKRIVFSNDGLIYYTSDHYETFTLLYGEP